MDWFSFACWVLGIAVALFLLVCVVAPWIWDHLTGQTNLDRSERGGRGRRFRRR